MNDHKRALECARNAEVEILEITNGKRKPGRFTVEHIARLVQYVRTGNVAPASLTAEEPVVPVLQGEELEEYLYVTLANEFYGRFSKLVADMLMKAPPDRRQDLLAKLGDMSSVYGSDYSSYLEE